MLFALIAGAGTAITPWASTFSMRDLATKIGRLTGYTGDISYHASRPNGQPRLMLDVSRATEKLRFGFVARTTFDEGLTKTIAWYREHSHQSLPREAARANNA